jgi:DNA-binding transcriptional ArsR family regulator
VSPRPRGLAELDAIDAVFGALANRTRRTILLVLHTRGGEMTSGAIAGRFDCAWPTTSQHLRILEQAGLVTIQLRGRERVYRLDRDRLRTVAGAWLDRFTEPRDDDAAGSEDSEATGRTGAVVQAG